MRIAFVSYGHERIASMREAPLNSVLLTNHGAYLGCCQVGEVVDYSPLVDEHGVQWGELHKMAGRIEPADLLYCQASVSLEAMRRWRAICGSAPIVLQRDSTHARAHFQLMCEAMERHGVEWQHDYAKQDFSLLNREEEEYQLADRIFVLSRWVHSTFESMGLGDKATQFASQCIELVRWPRRDGRRAPHFTALFAGQLGLRKGTLDLLAAWRSFGARHPEARLLVAGLPEHNAPADLRRRLERELATTPGVAPLNWVDMAAMPDWYAKAHVFVSPSVEDGSTMTGVEAAAMGLPIIATNNAGIDILEHGVTGREVPVGSPEQICEALEDAYQRPDEWRQMGERAHERAQQCDVQAFAAGVAGALREVLR